MLGYKGQLIRGEFMIINQNHVRQAGYSLVGVSLFIVVLGIMVAGGLNLKQKYDWAQRSNTSSDNMAIVKEAIGKYQTKHGKLPCPAPLNAALDSPNFGRSTNCNSPADNLGTFEDQSASGEFIRYGAIPVRTLEISDNLIADGWKHRYVYAVTKYYTVGTPNYKLDKGAIDIRGGKDIKGKTRHITKDKANVIYALLSPGADKRGAYTLQGQLLDEEPCKGTNCLNDKDGKLQVSIFRQYDTGVAADNKDFTATMTYEASSVGYEWRSGKWGKCGCTTPKEYPVGRCEISHSGKTGEVNTIASMTTPPCISGTQFNVTERCCTNPKKTRDVKCYNITTNKVVNDKYCAAHLKPDTSENCSQFCWTKPEYQACPTSPCGLGPSVQPLIPDTLYCHVNNKDKTVDSACVENNKPADFVYCPGTGSCPQPDEGGGYVDLDGDGRYETHISDAPNGYSGPSSSTRNSTIADGSSNKDLHGNYTGDHQNGDNGYHPVPQW